MASARGKSHSANRYAADEGEQGCDNAGDHHTTGSAQGRQLRSGRPKQRAAANQSPQQIGSGQNTLGDSADEDISWLALVDMEPLVSDFSPTSSRTGAVFGAVSPQAKSNPVGLQPTPAAADCNTAGRSAPQQWTSSESLCSNSALAAFDALMRDAMDSVGQELESSAAIEHGVAARATDMAGQGNDTHLPLHHMRSSLDDFDLALRDLVTPRAAAFSGESLIWPQPSLETGGPSGVVGDPGQNWRWHGGPPGAFLAGHGGREERQTMLKINRRHSIAGPGVNEYLLESRYHSAQELPILETLLTTPDLDVYTPQAAAHTPGHAGFFKSPVQQRSPVLAATPRQIRTSDVAADVAGSPGNTRLGAAGRLRQGIIRTQSQDFTIDPETGRMLRFGPAMAVRANAVELPSVTALFADVSSRGLKRQRRWSPSTPLTPTARKANTGKRRNHSPKSPAYASDPDQELDRNASAHRDGQIWRSMCQQMLQLRAPASAHQPPRSPPLRPLLEKPADLTQYQPTSMHHGYPQQQRCFQESAEWQESILKREQMTGQGEQSDAVQEMEIERSQGLPDDTRQVLQGLQESSDGDLGDHITQAAQLACRHPATQQVLNHEGNPGKQGTRQNRRACQSAASGQSTFTQDLNPAEPKEETSGSDSEDALGPSTRAPMGFGGITRSVIRAAEASGKHKAPVFRLEELHRAHSQHEQQQQQQQQRFKGVSRCPWSLTWDAHVTSPAAGLRAQLGLAPLLPEDAQDKGGTEEPAIFLGTFLTQTTAAKAHDVATLKILRGIPTADNDGDVAPAACDTTVDLNFSADNYHQGMEETRETSTTDFVQLLRQHSAFEMQRTSRYKGVHMLTDHEWVARFLEEEDASMGF